MDTEIPDLSFQLNVSCSASYAQFLDWFRNEWFELGIDWKDNVGLGSTPDNWFDLGYEYPDWPRLTPMTFIVIVGFRRNQSLSMADLDTQTELAHLLIARLKEKGCAVEFNGYLEV